MLARRRFLDLTTGSLVSATARPARAGSGRVPNDVRSGLYRTMASGVHRPGSQAQMQGIIREAARRGRALSIAGRAASSS